jgi:sugar phosphate isomerase/epimerase
MAHPLAIELITALGQNPADMVHLAADLGVPRIGLALTPVAVVPDTAPHWNLREDQPLYRAVKVALAERGVQMALGEGFLIHPQMDMPASASDLDLLAELGTVRVNCVALEQDVSRCHDQFALFASLAAERGMGATIEYMPFVAVDTLAKAMACVDASGVAGAGVLLDSLHFFRTGTTFAELAAINPAKIGHAQLCDAPADLPDDRYMDVAKFERLIPGHGELPLAQFLAALPDGLTVGLEVPQRALALAGEDHRTRIGNIIAAARSFSTDLL